MKSLIDTILVNFPAAVDCLDGHIGPRVEVAEREEADDRYDDVIVTRCEHCNMALDVRYA